MNLTDSKLRANRENAQHSTGPRTDEGKKRSSLNALRHGFTSQVVVLPNEDMQAAEINTGHPEVHAALTAARVLRDYSGQLESISRHEYRVSRMYQTTLKELKEAQQHRRIQEKIEFAEAEDLYLTAKMKGIPYNPAEDGFVLTVAQMDARGARLDRRFEAKIARQHKFNLEKFTAAMAS